MKQHYPLDPVTGIENPALAWANGNPSTGVDGSYPPYGLFLDPQKELLNLQRAAGLTDSADGSDTAQASQAISRGTWLGTLSQPATANDVVTALPGSMVWPLLLIGMEFSGVVSAANTGPMTVTMTGFGTLPGKLNLVGRAGGALAAGDVPANVPFKFRFDGAAFRVTGSVASDIPNVINTYRIVGGVPKAYSIPGVYNLAIAAGTTITIVVRGAGGGGGGCYGSGAGASGGGGGGYSLKVVTATIATVLQIAVGAGGAGGSATNPPTGGTAGGTSYVSVLSGSVTDGTNTFAAGTIVNAATGGGGGAGGNGGLQSSFFGASGVPSGGDLNKAGDTGGYPYSVGSGIIGGSGGASPYSGSSPGPNLSAAGITSFAAGVGGNGDSGAKGGGPGSPGEVTIYGAR